jgi:hypothetical protein
MTTINIPDDLADEINKIAQEEQIEIAEALQLLVREHRTNSSVRRRFSAEERAEMHKRRMEAVGMFDDDDITTLSMTKKETLRKIFEEKYGNTD